MKNFFKGISFSQIGAGALAAVTSFLLASKIGLAGSVIGVAIGSIVSAVSTQLYQNVLKASSKKIQEAAPFHGQDEGDGQGGGDGRQADDASVSTTALSSTAGSTTAVSPPVGTDGETNHEHGETARVISSNGTIEPGVTHDVAIGSDGAPHVKAPQVGTTHETQRHKKIAIIVSVVSALVAVLITAGVITLITRGEGTDSVVRDWAGNSSVRKSVPSRRSTPVEEPSPSASSTAPSSDQPSQNSQEPQQEGQSSSPSPSSSATTGGGTNGGQTNGTNGGGDSDSNGSDSGDGSGTGTDSRRGSGEEGTSGSTSSSAPGSGASTPANGNAAGGNNAAGGTGK